MSTPLAPKHGNTRFNPTTTGDLHLGHLYLCKVNEYEAHSRGAKFYVRFDDTQMPWRYHDSDPLTMMRYSGRNRQDLEWLGIEVDGWYWQSAMQHRARKEVKAIYGMDLPLEQMAYDQFPTVLGWDCLPYPYAGSLVPEKVWLDYTMLTDLLIRGNDLITEYALYCHWVEFFRLYRVYHVYLPRLVCNDGDPSYVGQITKTHGHLTVRQFREQGWEPEEILLALRGACLKDKEGPWSIENVKERPVWNSAG